jgi:hypothetical protein
MWDSFKSWVAALHGRVHLGELVINERIMLNGFGKNLV